LPPAVLTISVVGLLGLTAPPAAALAPADGTVFINEIHYDNDGADAGEAIEIAGPAGTDLARWSLVLYNGSNSAAYDTVALSGTLSDQDGGFGTVSFSAAGLQNGDPDGIALVDASGALVQFLSYEGRFTATSGPAAGTTSTDIGVRETSGTAVGSSLQLTGTGASYGDFTWAVVADDSFGQINVAQTSEEPGPVPEPQPEPAACDIAVTNEIGDVQGTGTESALQGRTVTVEGVVVGDFQASGQLGGVFLQDADGDGSPETSDGIFVYDPDALAVAPGDVVRVTGTVTEFRGATQIADVRTIDDCGDGRVPEPTVLELPADDATRERLEGMLVTLAEPVTATETYDLARYGELVVSADGRLYQPTNEDDGDVAAEQQANDERRLVIDDATTVQNPDVVPFTEGGVVRLGDTVTDVVGVLTYGFDAWRLQPTADPVVQRTNPRPAGPEDVGGAVQVASFNVLNYFTTLDADGATTDTGDEPRGANSAEEFQRQQVKIVAAILALDAGVVGLMEIENDSDDAALQNLVAALNATAGEERYTAVQEPDTGAGLFGTDAIKTALIYQPDEVVPLGSSVTTTDDAFVNARLPLAQRFRPVDGGKPLTVVVNHFKSKGCGSGGGAATGANADQGDGQGCFNADRVEQAQALLDLIGGLPDEDVLIIGDLNSYGSEDPIDVLTGAGFVDLVDTLEPEAEQYSYVFQGQAGYLDHALASPQLAQRITGADIWHINSDEPRFLDYNTEFNPAEFYAPDLYRSSDHDPVLVGIGATPGNGPR
jgi:predicted extracellular nuclease